MDKIVVFMTIGLGAIVLVLGSLLALTINNYPRNDLSPSLVVPPHNSSTFDTSRLHLILPYPDDVHLKGDVVTKSLDAAAAIAPTQDFLKFSGNNTFAQIKYIPADKVHVMKSNSRTFSFLPDASDIIVIFMGAPRGGIEEYPMLYVYIEPQTYHVLGFIKEFWA
jgi:hypothetical protein